MVLKELYLSAQSTLASLGSVLRVDIFRGSTISSTSAGVTPVQILPYSLPASLRRR